MSPSVWRVWIDYANRLIKKRISLTTHLQNDHNGVTQLIQEILLRVYSAFLQGKIGANTMGTELKTRIHPETMEELKRRNRPLLITYKGLEETVDMPGWYPKDNDDGIYSKEDRKVYGKALRRMKARYEKLLLPEEIKNVRKQLHLSQEEAGFRIGGGPQAFQKYESGDVLPNRAISNLLTILAKEPAMLDLLPN